MSFPGFTNQFNNSPYSVAFSSYLPLSIGATPPEQPSPIQLYWSFQAPYEPNVFSQVIQITTNDDATNTVVLPDATVTTVGQSCNIYNSTDLDIVLSPFGGGTPISIAAQGLYDLILTSNLDQTGWIAVPLSIGTPIIDPITLVDQGTESTTGTAKSLNGGLAVVADAGTEPGTYLKTNMNVINYTTNADYTQSPGDRGTLIVWDTGSFDYILMSAATAGDGFTFSINNIQTTAGTCTLIPNGTDTVDGSANDFTILPAQSLSLISDGVGNWTTLGYGLNTTPTTFTDVTIELASSSSNLEPSLSFFADTSLGWFYASANPGTIPNWAGPSAEILQQGVALADFQQNATYPGGLVTLVPTGTFQTAGSSFSPTAITLTSGVTNNVTNYVQQRGISMYSLMRAYS